MIGFTANELNEYGSDRYRAEYFHPDDANIWEESYKHIMEHGKASVVYRQKDKNGNWIKIYGASKLVTSDPDCAKTVNIGFVIDEALSGFTKIEELLKENAYLKNKIKFEQLTNREKEVLKRLCNGMSSKDVAKELFISPHTVESHRKNIMKKLNTHNIADLTRIVTEAGLYH